MDFFQLDTYRWQIPKTGAMQVPGIIYTDDEGISGIRRDQSFRQVANVACLPGIIHAAMAMPDIHLGYGFPIGGVAAFDWENGVISPGGVGYDINCGVRLASTHLTEQEIRPRLEDLAVGLFREIPTGVGSEGAVILSAADEKKVLRKGSAWAVEQGFGVASDVERAENEGCLPDADPGLLSPRALERGKSQLGTLGSGNHFLEVGVVDQVFDPDKAAVFGLSQGRVTLMLHSGSRGLGYQVCDDHLALMAKQPPKWQLPDRQLACAPIQSPRGQAYLRAMACAANYAWANRQILLHLARRVFMAVLSISPRSLGMAMVYDVCHNIAKKETHVADGQKRSVCVVRKGATRSFGPGHPDLPDIYRKTGQPILIPGDMGTASYVLSGTEKAMTDTFGSTCHGAGRVLSRKAAKKRAKGRSIHTELAKKGIHVKWRGRFTLSEEMPDAYKNISKVVGIVHGAGISTRVARLRPLAVIKG